jgi:hypothetical protein
MKESEQVELTEFSGSDDDDGAPERDDAPPPVSNTTDVQYLIETVGRLTDQVGDIVTELEQRETNPDSIDTKPTDVTERMFQ